MDETKNTISQFQICVSFLEIKNDTAFWQSTLEMLVDDVELSLNIPVYFSTTNSSPHSSIMARWRRGRMITSWGKNSWFCWRHSPSRVPWIWPMSVLKKGNQAMLFQPSQDALNSGMSMSPAESKLPLTTSLSAMTERTDGFNNRLAWHTRTAQPSSNKVGPRGSFLNGTLPCITYTTHTYAHAHAHTHTYAQPREPILL